MTIGSNIKRLRVNAGLSQEELGKKINKTRSAVSYYESDKITPRMGVIEDLAAVFQVPKTEIIETQQTISYACMTLSEEEANIVSIYRKLPPKAKASFVAGLKVYEQ